MYYIGCTWFTYSFRDQVKAFIKVNDAENQTLIATKATYVYQVHTINSLIKFMLSKKAIKIEEVFIVDLTLCSKRQIDGEDLFNFLGLLRKYEL